MTPLTATGAPRRRLAAEVLELGETLFDAVLDAALAHAGAEESEPLPEAELRTAAEEFFQTMRILLGVHEAESVSLAQDSSSSDSMTTA
jgi:hypothetical protein